LESVLGASPREFESRILRRSLAARTLGSADSTGWPSGVPHRGRCNGSGVPAWVVESAAGSSQLVAGLLEQMTANRRFGAHWAATTLLTKSGHRPGLTLEQAERDFVIAMDWGTYRTLTGELGLTPGQIRDWIHSYYQRMFLSQAQATPPS
jgi:hypothetical protein